MSFEEEFRAIYAAVERVASLKKVRARVLDEAKVLAAETVQRVMANDQDPFEHFTGVKFSNEDEKDEFLLVLEFLKTSGFKFGSAVLSFESQHPELRVDRGDLCRRLSLDEGDERPLIVQMVDAHMKWLESKPSR